MQQYVVPQFIDVEGKIIGPITTRQFVMILVGGLVLFLAFRFLNFTGFLFVGIMNLLLVIVFGFVKVNGRPFHLFLRDMIQVVFKNPKLKVWLREAETVKTKAKKESGKEKDILDSTPLIEPALGISAKARLSELSLIVDTGGAYNKDEEEAYV